MYDQLSARPLLAMLPQVNALPSAQQQPSPPNWNRFGGLGEGSTQVGGHIVGAFGAVVIVRTFGGEFSEVGGKIRQHVRVGIFLNDQAGGGVAQKEGTEAGLHLGCSDDGLNLSGNVMEAFALGLDGEEFLIVRHGQVSNNRVTVGKNTPENPKKFALGRLFRQQFLAFRR
jgi:hypothetical protein